MLSIEKAGHWRNRMSALNKVSFSCNLLPGSTHQANSHERFAIVSMPDVIRDVTWAWTCDRTTRPQHWPPRYHSLYKMIRHTYIQQFLNIVALLRLVTFSNVIKRHSNRSMRVMWASESISYRNSASMCKIKISYWHKWLWHLEIAFCCSTKYIGQRRAKKQNELGSNKNGTTYREKSEDPPVLWVALITCSCTQWVYFSLSMSESSSAGSTVRCGQSDRSHGNMTDVLRLCCSFIDLMF